MSGELKIQTGDGTIYWFGRDDHYPDEVRVYGQDTRHWSYISTDEAHSIVDQGLRDGECSKVTPSASSVRKERLRPTTDPLRVRR
ncbi:MAG: hypothetical protein WBW04_21965 [Nitrolancea sp.]